LKDAIVLVAPASGAACRESAATKLWSHAWELSIIRKLNGFCYSN